MRWGISVAGIMLAAACGGSTASQSPNSDASLQDGSKTDASASDATSVCTPGQSIACVGPGGCSGGQICNASGSGYLSCDCATSADSGAESGHKDAEATVDATSDNNAPGDASGDGSVEGSADASSDASVEGGNDGCALVQHADGYGQSFSDCVPFGTYSLQLALDACEAYAQSGVILPDATVCEPTTCGGAEVVEFDNEACILWEYSGPAMGFAAEGSVGGPCVCPTVGGTGWE
jgi:hypothetical protein